MSDSKYLVFPHAMVGGMTNLLMELEIRVILADLADRTLVSINKIPCSPMPDDHLYGRYRSATMLDLFDFPVKHIGLTKLYKNGFKDLYVLPWQGECASQAYFVHSDNNQFDETVVNAFKENRQHQWAFPDNDVDTWCAMNQQRTFCSYSYFFLAPESIKRRIRKSHLLWLRFMLLLFMLLLLGHQFIGLDLEHGLEPCFFSSIRLERTQDNFEK